MIDQIHRHNNILRLMRCGLMIALAFLLTACGMGGNTGADSLLVENIPGGPASTAHSGNAPSGREWVYVPEVIAIEDEEADYSRMQLVGDVLCYLSRRREDEDNTQEIRRYCLTDRSLTSVSMKWPDEEKNREVGAFGFARDYSAYVMANVYSSDYGQLRRFLCRFDREGKCLFYRDITEQVGRELSVTGLRVDGQGRVYIFTRDEGIRLYDGDGNYAGAIAYPSSEGVWVKSAADGRDGRFYVCLGREGGAEFHEDSVILAEVDFEGCRLTEIGEGFENLGGLGEISGADYDFLLYDSLFVYGYDLSAQKMEELFFWLDSDINGAAVVNLGTLEDGRICVAVEDWMYHDRNIVLLAKTRAEDVAAKENLVLATVGGENDRAAMAVRYNRDNPSYHLTVKNYDSLTDLYNAILVKEELDIIDLSGVNAQRLAAQGALEDLTAYLDQSAMFSADDFLEGILDVYTFDGKLVSIPDTFALRTVVGSRAYSGSGAGLTLDGLLDVAKRYPQAKAFDEITREEMMQYLMMFNEEAFVDWNTGECYFNSDTFKEVLEFVKAFPDSVEETPGEASVPTKIQSGQVLFAIADLYGLRELQPYGEMFGGNDACVGFPTADGSGGNLLLTGDAFAILSGSGHKEGAWKFIESILGGEHEEFAGYFPVLREGMNGVIEEALERDRQIDPDHFPIQLYRDEWSFQYHALTREEIDTFLGLIKDAEPFFDCGEDAVIRIINEEAGGYYSGQRSAEDVADVIQNRVSLYVKENL